MSTGTCLNKRMFEDVGWPRAVSGYAFLTSTATRPVGPALHCTALHGRHYFTHRRPGFLLQPYLGTLAPLAPTSGNLVTWQPSTHLVPEARPVDHWKKGRTILQYTARDTRPREGDTGDTSDTADTRGSGGPSRGPGGPSRGPGRIPGGREGPR
jgi:hypothetical protein